MTRPRALTSTLRTLIALLTALVVSVLGATALPAAALAGHGQAKGHQADHANKPDKATHTKANNGKAHQAATTHQASKTQGGGSAKPQQSAAAQESQPTRGNSAQAHSKTSHSAGKSAGTSGGSSGGKGDPAGNNGTVKLAGFDAPNGPGHSSGDGSTPMHPSNDPHLPCGFSVEGYGFDAVASQSEVTFEQHAPTGGGSPQHGSVPLDQDSHTWGGSTAGYDGVQDFNLTFAGDPHPKHGYHVKLTAYTDYSQGSNAKHKVFWVEPCETTTTPPGGDTPGGDTPGGDTPGGDTPGGDTPGGVTPGGVQETVDQNGGNTSTVVLGAQASVKNSQGTQAATQAAGAQAAQVPTAIESGLSGQEWSRSVLPLLLVMLGLGTTFVALVRRRTRVQPIRND